jgi:hypothetical protein
MRKSVFALAAVLALGSLSLTTDAFARGGGHGGGGHGGGHGGGGHGGGHFGGHGPGGHFGGHGGGHFGGGHGGRVFVAGGHGRRFWHGRWWGYGIGPCWKWSYAYGEYVWVCD